MSIIAKWNDGKEYAAADWFELASITKLDVIGAMPDGNVQTWMDGVARRTMHFEGKPISFNDPESFFRELQRIGLITDLIVKPSMKKDVV